MTNRKLLTLSSILLVIAGIRAAWNFPSILAAARASGASFEFSAGRIFGASIGALIWFFLAIAQTLNKGRWGLGIGIYASIVFTAQTAVMYMAVSSGRVVWDASSITQFVLFTVFVIGGLSAVNFCLYAKQKNNSA